MMTFNLSFFAFKIDVKLKASCFENIYQWTGAWWKFRNFLKNRKKGLVDDGGDGGGRASSRAPRRKRDAGEREFDLDALPWD